MNNDGKEKIDVLLVRPPYFDAYGSVPLGLAYLAAVLRKNGFTVSVFDCVIQKRPYQALETILSRFSPSLVGITCCTPMQKATLDVARVVKSKSDAVVVVGGPHPTACPEEMLRDPNIDVVVIGEGEATLPELTAAVIKKENISQIQGLAFKKDGKIAFTEPRPLIMDLDSIPFPALDLFPVSDYYRPGMSSGGWTKYRSYISILTSRGCPGKCIFCFKGISGNRWRARSPDNVVNEIEQIVQNYKIKEIQIVDDCFSLNKKRAIGICNEIIRRKINIAIRFANGLRVDTVDRNLLERFRLAGCYSLSYGIESGSQEILNRIGKGITLEQVEKAVRMTKEVRIKVCGYFIIGLPGETMESAKQTIEFAKKLDLDQAAFFVAIPFPGTEMHKYFLNKGFILSFNYDRYEFFHESAIRTEALTAKQLARLQSIAYREFYFRPKIIWKHLCEFLPYVDYRRIFTWSVIRRFLR